MLTRARESASRERAETRARPSGDQARVGVSVAVPPHVAFDIFTNEIDPVVAARAGFARRGSAAASFDWSRVSAGSCLSPSTARAASVFVVGTCASAQGRLRGSCSRGATAHSPLTSGPSRSEFLAERHDGDGDSHRLGVHSQLMQQNWWRRSSALSACGEARISRSTNRRGREELVPASRGGRRPHVPGDVPELASACRAPFASGYAYEPEFLSGAEESSLIITIEQLPLANARYKQFRQAACSQLQRPLRLRREPVERGGPRACVPSAVTCARGPVGWRRPEQLTHALVAEYSSTQLGWHRDVPDFELVIGVSLLSAADALSPLPARPSREINRHRARAALGYRPEAEAAQGWQHSVPAVPALCADHVRTLRDKALR